MLKNKLCIILIAMLLALPAIALPEDDIATSPIDEEAVETVQSNEPSHYTPEPTVPNEDIISTNTYKQPTSKKRVIKKFLLAMFGVFVSSFIIFAGLSIYNRIREGFTVQNYDSKRNENSLETPANLQQAISSFIEKTKWN